MKSEKEILEEIDRLKKCIEKRNIWISLINVDLESEIIYKDEIEDIKSDIERLKWVLCD